MINDVYNNDHCFGGGVYKGDGSVLSDCDKWDCVRHCTASQVIGYCSPSTPCFTEGGLAAPAGYESVNTMMSSLMNRTT